MTELVLFYAPGASSMAPHIALHEIGAPFEGRPMSFHKAETRSPGFLALNPEGKVPLLLIDGAPLAEVAAILFYLARRFPDAGLWPEDLAAQAQAVSWMSFIASTLHPARRQGLDQARKVYALADQRLGGRDWAVDRYSVADIHLFRLFWRFRASLQPVAGDFANLERHQAAMMDRPAVRKTIDIESAVGYELPA